MSKNLQKMVSIVAEADLVSQVYPLLEARSKIKEAFQSEFEVSNSHLFDITLKDKKNGEVYELVWVWRDESNHGYLQRLRRCIYRSACADLFIDGGLL